jgi:PAS domain S-box-containing protein
VVEPSDEGGEAPCFAHLIDVPKSVSDAELVDLAHRLADALVIADHDGMITFWNAAAERLLGWTAEQAIGQTLDLIVPERHRERHWTGYRQTMATGETRYGSQLLEVPALHRDGRTLSIAFTVTLLPPLPGGTGERSIAAVIRDDTAHREERRQLRDRLRALEAAAES